ncbi:hypothetical protein [Ancylobacter pratisalsi]|uniref:Uncharacterized protein n=1 Tax=Ancylobacter pratisalsi TaxID=1745854 RepID=A0A6P1YLM2_9HYPH|nr:hypothetical protein [Ancylobacter pratisalsi]QIB34337.1 hypothetical protein G3A50_11930 [Ancylobacter pratisalsi]
MTPKALLLATLASASLLAAGSVQAADPAIKLHQGDMFTDPVGTVLNVSVTNGTPATLASVEVTCDFTSGGKPAGQASTTIYNIVAGAKGEDQVHLMGPEADAATCAIASTSATK